MCVQEYAGTWYTWCKGECTYVHMNVEVRGKPHVLSHRCSLPSFWDRPPDWPGTPQTGRENGLSVSPHVATSLAVGLYFVTIPCWFFCGFWESNTDPQDCKARNWAFSLAHQYTFPTWCLSNKNHGSNNVLHTVLELWGGWFIHDMKETFS